MKKELLITAGVFTLFLLVACSKSPNINVDVTTTDENLQYNNSPSSLEFVPTTTPAVSAKPTEEAVPEAITPSNTPIPIVVSGTRDNTPHCLVPVADGINVYSNDLVIVDASHVSEGYVMVSYLGTCGKVKLQIIGSDAVTYTYNLMDGYEVFPLSAGSGSYDVAVYENITDTQYSTAFYETISVAIANTFGPFLYPNQYVTFYNSSNCVSKAKELAKMANSDLDVVGFIYNYVSTNITYDYDKANSVQSGYLPNPDAILKSKKGICLDYASLMVAMLRSQKIPARLEVGYAGEAYHAWISTYIKDVGWINGIISFDGKSWKIMDPTFAASNSEEDLQNFIGNGSNYVTKYIY